MYLAVDFQGGIENAWPNVATVVPKLVAPLVILVVGWIVAKAVASSATGTRRPAGPSSAVHRVR